MAYYYDKYGKLTSTYGLVGDNNEAKEAEAANCRKPNPRKKE